MPLWRRKSPNWKHRNSFSASPRKLGDKSRSRQTTVFLFSLAEKKRGIKSGAKNESIKQIKTARKKRQNTEKGVFFHP
jgi:hypothetical protein